MPIEIILLIAAAAAAAAAMAKAKSSAKSKFTNKKVGDTCKKCKEKKEQAEFEKAISNINIVGDDTYKKKVKKDLKRIYQTKNGKAMLESLMKSKKTVTIRDRLADQTGNECGYKNPSDRFRQSDGKPGKGTDSTVYYDPDDTTTGGNQKWSKRPAAIGLAHELVHAEQATHGTMKQGKAKNDGLSSQANVRELEAVGIAPQDKNPYSENKIRSQWKPKQPRRKWY